MKTQRSNLFVRLLGPPYFLAAGRPITFPTRKSMGLCIYLAANSGRHLERLSLSGLLWSGSSMEHARVSLRKSLSLLSASESCSKLLGKDRASVWYAGDPTQSDLAAFNRCIAAGTERAYREALALWRGPPLEGFDLGEPAFDEWAATFRNDTVALTHRHLAERLLAIDPERSASLELALCRLIARIEPADTDANERLIRRLAEQDDASGAMRQYNAYAQALAELDVPVAPDLRDFADRLRQHQEHTTTTSPREAVPAFGRPRVEIVRHPDASDSGDLFSYAHSEVLCQLTRFRSIRCLERADTAGEVPAPASRLIGVSEGSSHDYRVTMWDEPRAKAIYLRCMNAQRLDTVSVTRLSYEELADRRRAETAIATAINAVERDILLDEPPHDGTPFARWLDAFHLLQQFTPRADAAALSLLEDIAKDPRGKRLSVVHASIASVLMKRRMFLPGQPDPMQDLRRAGDSVSRALGLDQLEPFNHVMFGWLRIQMRDHERALTSFDAARKLNPYSARTLISSAEAAAFCGDIGKARQLADEAMVLSGRYAPPYFYGYMAHIHYLAGELDDCVRMLHHSPDNLNSAVLAVAVHQERGDMEAATAARVRFERELRALEPESPIDLKTVSEWLSTTALTRDEAARRRLFQSLERAGLPVPDAAVT